MKIALTLVLLVISIVPVLAQPDNRTGTVIFAAYTDTNLDGAIMTDQDGINLFALNIQTRQITLLGERPALPILPILSPDRSQLAFIDRRGQIIVTRLDGSPQVVGTNASSLAWLDNRRLVYRAGGERESLFLTYLNGQTLPLTAPTLERDLIQVNPAGTQLLFTQTVVDTNLSGAIGLPGDVNRLYRYDLTTGEIRIVAEGIFRVESPRFSPDGRSIAYVQVADTSRDGQYSEIDARSLWLLDASGNPITRLSPEASVGAEGVVWNATGTHILFVHQPDLDVNGLRTADDPLQIGIVSVIEGGFNVLAQAVKITQLVSSPDGVWFAYAATVDDSDANGFITPEDAESLHVVNTNSASPVRLSPEGVLVTGAMAFAPGSSRLAYVAAIQDADGDTRLTYDDATALFISDLGAEPAGEPLTGFNRLGQVAWDTAGEHLIASVDQGQLVLVDPESSATLDLLDAGYQVDLAYPLMWLP